MTLVKKFLLLVIPCLVYTKQELSAERPIQWMTVFVHGTTGATSNISIANIYRVMADKVKNSCYEKAVDLIRTNPYMYKNQPMQEYGLKRIDHKVGFSGDASALFAHAYDAILQETLNEDTHDHVYYTFGWSGLLGESIRYHNASVFYKELLHEYHQQQINNPHKEIKICLVAYSHGGTMTLQLARVFEKELTHQPLTIDLLVLIGTPIQKETSHLVTSPLFKKVYHIYSRGDKIQKLDFFSFERFFSHRRFNDDNRFVTPEKIIQIELKLKPARRAYKPGEKKTYVNRSPGHIELWFFGWTGGTYRHDFPLYPLPTACLIPQIIKAAQEGMPHETDLVVELYPCAEKCLVKKRRYFKKVQTKGIKQTTLKKLQETAHRERPQDFNRKEYLMHMQTAVNQAYQTVGHNHSWLSKCYDFSCKEREKRK